MRGCFGFPAEPGLREWRDVLIWLLAWLVNLTLSGRQAAWERRGGAYMSLLRFRSWKAWWRSVCRKQLGTCLLLTSVLAILTAVTGGYGAAELAAGAALLGVSFAVVDLIQAFCLIKTGNDRLVFGVEAIFLISVLAVPAEVAVWHPASFSMLTRSAWKISRGFSPAVVAAELLLIAAMVVLAVPKTGRMGGVNE